MSNRLNGINIPLSALRSEKSCGIGEFFDLIPLIDWCAEVGFEIIQFLPLNDSGPDPSPYNAISSCALNPIYLSLHKLTDVSNPELEGADQILYPEVQSFKLNFLRDHFKTVKEKLLTSKEFVTFLKLNPWLDGYSLYKVLKDRLGQNPWTTWPEELKFPNFDALLEKHNDEMDFYRFVQFLSFQQLSEVRAYARSKGVAFKGDIPILISPDSADCWLHPEIFDFTLAAGAPPDAYNPKGQYWGFPLFNWEIIRKNHFRWWHERLDTAARYYSYFRIDHVVGFFRIWAIPLGHEASEGRFIPEDPSLWVPQGKEILEMMLKTTEMVPIAEDLGIIPPEVRSCLKEMGIAGTKVIRWERRYDTGGSFIPYRDYPENALCCVSTHDSEPLQLFWQKKPEEAKAFCQFKGWSYSPTLKTEERAEILRDAHETPCRYVINLLPEYLALFPELVHKSPEEERINVPGTLSESNWAYRLVPTVEAIRAHPQLKEAVRRLLYGVQGISAITSCVKAPAVSRSQAG